MSEIKYGGFFNSTEENPEPIETKPYVQERAKFAGDIRNLYYLSIVAVITTVLDSFSILSSLCSVVNVGCGIFTLVIFFRMGKLIEEYKKAAVLQIAVVAMAVVAVVAGVIAELSIGGGTIIMAIIVIIAAIVSLCAVYNEFQGHNTILSSIDDELSEKWNTLWTWNILSIVISVIGGFIGALLALAVPVLGIIVVLIVAVISIAVTIMKVVYLKRMTDLFDELSVKCERAIKEAAEAELE